MVAVSNVQEQSVLFSSVSPHQGASLAIKLSDHSIQQEELVLPQTQNVPGMHPSSDDHEDERSFTIDLEASDSAREMSQTQHVVAHNDVQSSPQDGPLVVRSILDDTATFLEMERRAQNTNYTVEHSGPMRMATKF